MPSMKTRYYSMLSQTCKDCRYLEIDEHPGERGEVLIKDCDPPMGECSLDNKFEREVYRVDKGR